MFQRILVMNDNDKVAAAVEVATGLSTQDPTDPLKMPYSKENAAYAAANIYKLTEDETAKVVEAMMADA